MKIRLFLAPLAILLTGCAAYTPRIQSTEKPTLGDAYVYGRFFIDAPKVLLGFDGHASMGFGLKCADGGAYLLRFYNKNPVHVIKVKPSTCSVKEIVYSDADGTVRLRKPFTGSIMQNMELKAGFVSYIGDFSAQSSGSITSYNVYTTKWQVTDIQSNYAKTSAEMQEQYANLSSFATVDLSAKINPSADRQNEKTPEIKQQ
jgi:hypothetical protein